MQKKILIVHLNSNGDILLATPIARQIKEIDYKGCHLTWAVGSYCKSILANNPYIDEFIEVPLKDYRDTRSAWDNFYKETIKFKKEGIFDLIFYTQVIGDKKISLHNGYYRESILKGYPNKIKVPLIPIVRLDDIEILNVEKFINKNNWDKYSLKILFECSPSSGQFNITPDIAIKIASEIIKSNPDICFIISSAHKIISDYPNIIDGSELTLKENAELTKFCDLLVGCSSGISWISQSDWAKHIPMIQLLSTYSFSFNSFILDHRRFKLDHSDILELYNPSESLIIESIDTFIRYGISYVIKKYQENTHQSFQYFQYYYSLFLKNHQTRYALNLVFAYYKNYMFNRKFNNMFFKISFNWAKEKIRIRTRLRNFVSRKNN